MPAWSALHMKHWHQLAYALPHVIAVDPYPLRAWWRLLDDNVTVIVNIGWRGHAPPEYRIRARRAQGHRRNRPGRHRAERELASSFSDLELLADCAPILIAPREASNSDRTIKGPVGSRASTPVRGGHSSSRRSIRTGSGQAMKDRRKPSRWISSAIPSHAASFIPCAKSQ